jgi:hypothetical protein
MNAETRHSATGDHFSAGLAFPRRPAGSLRKAPDLPIRTDPADPSLRRIPHPPASTRFAENRPNPAESGRIRQCATVAGGPIPPPAPILAGRGIGCYTAVPEAPAACMPSRRLGNAMCFRFAKFQPSGIRTVAG